MALQDVLHRSPAFICGVSDVLTFFKTQLISASTLVHLEAVMYHERCILCSDVSTPHLWWHSDSLVQE